MERQHAVQNDLAQQESYALNLSSKVTGKGGGEDDGGGEERYGLGH